MNRIDYLAIMHGKDLNSTMKKVNGSDIEYLEGNWKEVGLNYDFCDGNVLFASLVGPWSAKMPQTGEMKSWYTFGTCDLEGKFPTDEDFSKQEKVSLSNHEATREGVDTLKNLLSRLNISSLPISVEEVFGGKK